MYTYKGGTQEFFIFGGGGALCRNKILGGPHIKKVYIIFNTYKGFFENYEEDWGGGARGISEKL